MTPCRLEDKQLANPVVALRYHDLNERGDWDSLHVWHRLMRLLAATQEPGTVRRGVELFEGESLARFVSLHLRCDEARASAALRTLSAAGLLHVENDALTLPVVPRRRGQSGNPPRQAKRPSLRLLPGGRS